MTDDQAARERHEVFIQAVLAEGCVYALRGDDGLVTGGFEVDGEHRDVVPFWSSAEDAEACAVEAWSECQLGTFALKEFVEEMLPNMDNEGVLVGTNWTPAGEGYWTSPKALFDELREAAGQG